MLRTSGIRLFAICLLAGLPFAPRATAQDDILSNHHIQPDVWRPMQPLEPGVNANGDLNMAIPILTVPGRGGLSFPISLSYRSGVQLTQASSWVGLGWNFDPGSITRDVQSFIRALNPTYGAGGVYDVDFASSPAEQPDQYFVSTPGGGFTMAAKTGNGTVVPAKRGTCPVGLRLVEHQAWRIDCTLSSTVAPGLSVDGKSVSVRNHSGTIQSYPADFSSFTLTSPEGVRYVFAHPTLASHELMAPNAVDRIRKYYVSTWRLVSVLSPDFRGNALDPRIGTTHGNWIYLRYTAPQSSYAYGDELTLTQASYLEAVETPSHVAFFATETKNNEMASRLGMANSSIYRRLNSITLCARVEGTAEADCAGVGQRVKKVNFYYQKVDTKARVSEDIALERMMLTGIAFEGSDGSALPGYSFSYYPGEVLLARSWTDYQDEFGYLNKCTSANTDP